MYNGIQVDNNQGGASHCVAITTKTSATTTRTIGTPGTTTDVKIQVYVSTTISVLTTIVYFVELSDM